MLTKKQIKAIRAGGCDSVIGEMIKTMDEMEAALRKISEDGPVVETDTDHSEWGNSGDSFSQGYSEGLMRAGETAREVLKRFDGGGGGMFSD